MSHPLPGHDYGEKTYPSDSPHKDSGYAPKKSSLPKEFIHSMRSSRKMLSKLHKQNGKMKALTKAKK